MDTSSVSPAISSTTDSLTTAPTPTAGDLETLSAARAQLIASLKPVPKKPKGKDKTNNERQRQWRERQATGAVKTAKAMQADRKKAWNAKFKSEQNLQVKYKPQAHQRKFRELLDSGRRIVLMLGGIRSGKTFAGAREALRRIYAQPTTRGIGWIVSPTYPMSLVVEREFEDACRISDTQSLIIKHYKNERAYLLYPPKNHFKPYRVEIKSAEHPDRLRGASLDWIWMDEAAMMSEETWKILLGRVLDSKGTIFLTTTPKGRNWIYHEIFQRAKDDNRIGIVRAVTSENEYLDKQDIDYLRSGYSLQFAQQELAAEFVNFEGLVYHSFDMDRNTCPPITSFPDGAEMVGGIDFGLDDPTVHLWLMRFNGIYYLVDEYYAKGRTLEDHARSIIACPWDRYTIRRWADPSAGQERLEFDKLGVGSYEARNDIRAGINSVQRLLETGRLKIAKNCINTLNEIGMYAYKHKADKNSEDVPVDNANHTMDALRYAIFNEEGFKAIHPFLTLSDSGQVVVNGANNDPLSNRLEDWVTARSHPMGFMIDDEVESSFA